MTRADVEAILGPPMSFSTPPKEYGDRWGTMTYSRDMFLVRSYTMLWIHLEDGRVREVYAKLYRTWSFDGELSLYVRRASEHWEMPEFDLMFRE